MSNPAPLSRRVASAVLRYRLSVLLGPCALLVTLLINPDTLIAPFFFLAILPSAWVGGMGPGLLAAAATLAVAYSDGAQSATFQFPVPTAEGTPRD
jgi:hypothetical protein